MHFTMPENALAHEGEIGRYFIWPNPKFTRQWKQASGILHPDAKNVTLFFFVPQKDIWELYSNHTVPLSVRPSRFMSRAYLLY